MKRLRREAMKLQKAIPSRNNPEITNPSDFERGSFTVLETEAEVLLEDCELKDCDRTGLEIAGAATVDFRA